jgi:hypothetical protein
MTAGLPRHGYARWDGWHCGSHLRTALASRSLMLEQGGLDASIQFQTEQVRPEVSECSASYDNFMLTILWRTPGMASTTPLKPSGPLRDRMYRCRTRLRLAPSLRWRHGRDLKYRPCSIFSYTSSVVATISLFKEAGLTPRKLDHQECPNRRTLWHSTQPTLLGRDSHHKK